MDGSDEAQKMTGGGQRYPTCRFNILCRGCVTSGYCTHEAYLFLTRNNVPSLHVGYDVELR
jgi:hypothetical protein